MGRAHELAETVRAAYRFGDTGADAAFDELARLAADSERYKAVLEEYVECGDWYRRNLEDVIDRRAVRGLAEAKSGYDRTHDAARAALTGREAG